MRLSQGPLKFEHSASIKLENLNLDVAGPQQGFLRLGKRNVAHR